MSAPKRNETVIGHLAAIAILSALAWWGLSLTALHPLVIAWLSGAVAGAVATLRATRAAGRKVAAASTKTTTKRSSR
ncbi:hypothetical protein IMZ11_41985 [Microtetraspora sp. AC03309]|uniref:hypothetical protein n=1 Tax=Microtetraspora sp. AC03309 TaxID=2779376 RepID=UPI001E558936|nr:hypothetical protein [Microtetraspora sp. AC03309]MCC5582181.1 hypothetical protein [Microtetraspora sp. AC03309]